MIVEAIAPYLVLGIGAGTGTDPLELRIVCVVSTRQVLHQTHVGRQFRIGLLQRALPCNAERLHRYIGHQFGGTADDGHVALIGPPIPAKGKLVLPVASLGNDVRVAQAKDDPAAGDVEIAANGIDRS